jgi:cobalt-zinc-cadmium resistance protein CzcA
MIKNIITFSINNRWIVIAASVVMMAVGYWCLVNIKIEAYPDIADTNVIVVAQYPGRAAEEVEQQVTIPIERALQNTPNVLDRRSRTIFGLSVVQLTFKDGTDDYFARQQVMERMASIDLPPDVLTPELAPLTTAVGEIMRYVVEAPSSYTPTQLRDLQDWVIKPYLLQVPGIADISTFGGPLKQFHVIASADKLRKYNLTMQNVIDAITKNNQNAGGNNVVRGEQAFAIRGLGVVKTESDIGNIILISSNGVSVFIKDVASVEITPPPPSGILGYTVNEENITVNSGVEGIILLRRKENPSEVLALMKQKIAELEANELPEDVKIRTLYDRSFLINHSLETVAHTLFMGVSIVVILLVFFLGNIRSALVVALTIPFALLFAFILMKITGIPANLLSLGAIDFGIIVDGACVMAEHLLRKYRTASPEEKKQGIIMLSINSANEVGREIFFSVTIIILAYLPILLMTRVEGKLFSPMALTLAFAVVGSMLAALTIIPVLLSFSFGKVISNPDVPLKEYKNFVIEFLQKWYRKILDITLTHYKRTVIIGFTIIAIMIACVIKLGTEFLPTLDEGSIFFRANFPSGVTIQENATYAPKIRKIIASYAPVSFVITQTGRNDDGTDPFPANRNEILVGLKEYSLWTDTISKAELLQRIKNDLEEELPAVRFSSGQPIIDQVMEIVNGSAADLAISIVGEDLDLMRSKGDSILNIVKHTAGSDNVNIEQEGPQEQLCIRINREKVARFGINVADVEMLIETAIAGKAVSVLYDGAKRYDIVVRYLPEDRNSIATISNAMIKSADGALIPLNQLADILFVQGQTNIYRYNNKRMITVRTNVKGRDQGGFVKELQNKVHKQIHIPKGYEIIFGGQYENLQRAGKQLLITIPLTIGMIFILLYILFKNMKYTFVTMTCILFALAGGICGLLLRGYYFNVSAGVGFVSIFGISVMTGVILISALNKKTEGLTGDRKEGVLEGSSEQMSALLSILMVAIIGLVPAYSSSGIGSDVQRPLSTVIIGGLTSTLIFAPIILPSLYLWAISKKEDTEPKQEEEKPAA